MLTTGRMESQEGARQRAKRKGLDLDAPYLVLAAQGTQPEHQRRLRGALERQLATMRMPALVREREHSAVALVSLASRARTEPRGLIDQLHRALRTTVGGAVAVGYGAVRSGAADVAGAAREAEQAVSMGRRLFGADSATAFADLGLYRLLYALQPLPELRAYREDLLGRLEYGVYS